MGVFYIMDAFWFWVLPNLCAICSYNALQKLPSLIGVIIKCMRILYNNLNNSFIDTNLIHNFFYINYIKLSSSTCFERHPLIFRRSMMLIVAQQIFHYKKIKIKLYKNNAAIWFNKTYRIKQLTPNYINTINIIDLLKMSR